MTRAEYMGRLREQLEKFGNELQQEIMEDYNQHFAEGEAEGRTDEEIIQDLGNIEDMIRELRYTEDVQPDKGGADAAQASGGPNVYGASEGGAGQGDAEAEAEQIAVPNDKASEGDFRSVVLKTGVADIVLVQSEDKAVHVDYRNDGSMEDQKKYEFYQYEKDGVFYAGVRRNKSYNDGTERSFSIGPTTITFHNNFNAGPRNKEIMLIARVPETIPEVKMDATSGNIEMSKLTLKKVKATVTSGDVKASEVVLEKLDTTTASGDIKAEGLTAETLNFTTASGDVKLRNVKSSKTGIITASGDVSCKGMISDKLDVKTASGDVELEADAGQYHLVTASGDVELCSGTAPEKVEVTTVSGDIELAMEKAEGAEVKVSSRSGDISINQKGNSINCRSGNVYTFGDGACKVSATTVSGDVNITM